MDTDLTTAMRNIEQSGDDAKEAKQRRYDLKAKEILAHKAILAGILQYTVKDFEGMSLEEVATRIEGEIFIGEVPIREGSTNSVFHAPQAEILDTKIMGANTEQAAQNEGQIRFDILFYVRLNDGVSQIIINLEAQQKTDPGYHLLNRAIYYGCRLISSEGSRDFSNSQYNDLKRVYTIWVCMEIEQTVWTHCGLEAHNIVGDFVWPGKLDLLNIEMLGSPVKFQDIAEADALHRLIGSIFAEGLTTEERLSLLEQEHGIPATREVKEGLYEMCDLGEGIFKRGEAQGFERGEAQGFERGRNDTLDKIVRKMRAAGATDEAIADMLECTIAYVKNVPDEPAEEA